MSACADFGAPRFQSVSTLEQQSAEGGRNPLAVTEGLHAILHHWLRQALIHRANHAHGKGKAPEPAASVKVRVLVGLAAAAAMPHRALRSTRAAAARPAGAAVLVGGLCKHAGSR